MVGKRGCYQLMQGGEVEKGRVGVSLLVWLRHGKNRNPKNRKPII